MLQVSDQEVIGIYVGNTPVKQVYLGDKLVYDSGTGTEET